MALGPLSEALSWPGDPRDPGVSSPPGGHLGHDRELLLSDSGTAQTDKEGSITGRAHRGSEKSQVNIQV